jgi:hypothetical protein
VGQDALRHGGAILRPLLWFGLLEYRSERAPDTQFAERHYYRKAPPFDRLLAFDVKTDFVVGPRHRRNHLFSGDQLASNTKASDLGKLSSRGRVWQCQSNTHKPESTGADVVLLLFQWMTTMPPVM